jgi:hypothetical protein
MNYRFSKLAKFLKKAQEFRAEENFKQLEEIENNPYAYLTFSTTTKFGVNPSSHYNTPNGVYCYKFDSISKLVNLDFPFATDKPLIHIFIADYHKILDLSIYDETTLAQDIEKLKNHYSQIDEQFINSALGSAPFGTEKPGAKLWAITYNLKRDSNDWTRIFKLLGYDGVEDHGYGIIHPSEPAQAVFFPQNGANLVKIFTIAKEGIKEQLSHPERKNLISQSEIDFNLKDLRKREFIKDNTKIKFDKSLVGKDPRLEKALYDYAKSLAETGDARFFEYGFSEIYQDLKEIIAKSWAEDGDWRFFNYHLQKTYPALERTIAETWAKRGDNRFFHYSLDKNKIYADLKETIANKMVEDGNVDFFRHALDKTYPALVETIAEIWARAGNSHFFYYYLQETYPELGRPMAESWARAGDPNFFEYGLQKTYPEMGRLLAERWAQTGNTNFFHYNLQETYLDLEETIAKSLAERGNDRFFEYRFQETYPDIVRTIAENWAKMGDERFFKYHLHKTYPELGEPIAESWAKMGYGRFFYYRLQEIYPEIGRPMAERMAEMGDSSFPYYRLQETYPGLVEVYNQAKASKQASTRERRFNKIARYLRISKLSIDNLEYKIAQWIDPEKAKEELGKVMQPRYEGVHSNRNVTYYDRLIGDQEKQDKRRDIKRYWNETVYSDPEMKNFIENDLVFAHVVGAYRRTKTDDIHGDILLANWIASNPGSLIGSKDEISVFAFTKNEFQEALLDSPLKGSFILVLRGRPTLMTKTDAATEISGSATDEVKKFYEHSGLRKRPLDPGYTESNLILNKDDFEKRSKDYSEVILGNWSIDYIIDNRGQGFENLSYNISEDKVSKSIQKLNDIKNSGQFGTSKLVDLFYELPNPLEPLYAYKINDIFDGLKNIVNAPFQIKRLKDGSLIDDLRYLNLFNLLKEYFTLLKEIASSLDTILPPVPGGTESFNIGLNPMEEKAVKYKLDKNKLEEMKNIIISRLEKISI